MRYAKGGLRSEVVHTVEGTLTTNTSKSLSQQLLIIYHAGRDYSQYSEHCTWGNKVSFPRLIAILFLIKYHVSRINDTPSASSTRKLAESSSLLSNHPRILGLPIQYSNLNL